MPFTARPLGFFVTTPSAPPPFPLILRYEIIKSLRQMTDKFHFPPVNPVTLHSHVQNFNYIKSIMAKINKTEFFFFMFMKY